MLFPAKYAIDIRLFFHVLHLCLLVRSLYFASFRIVVTNVDQNLISDQRNNNFKAKYLQNL